MALGAGKAVATYGHRLKPMKFIEDFVKALLDIPLEGIVLLLLMGVGVWPRA